MIGRSTSLVRWLLRGEQNVSASLEGLSNDLRALQERVDAADRRSDDVQRTATAAHLELVEALGELRLQLGALETMTAQRADADAWAVPDVRSAHGVNVIGYLQRQLGIGDVARRLATLLRDNGVATSAVAFGATSSPVAPVGFRLDQRLDHTNSIAVVAADQLPALQRTHPEAFAASERLIGYCFWELDSLSPPMRAGAQLVDEIWTGSRFVHDAFAELDATPVRHVPIPVEQPTPSDRGRDTFPPLADAGERTVFGVVFDHFSVAARKNPIGAIEAFCKAFEPDEGPLLVVKTLNADTCVDDHAALVAAARGRPDVVIWDAHLARPDHLALIGQFDVLVSLHRSEGLGLHLAEAMWLGVPVIATGYSGNLDLMDDSCALLVGSSLVEIDPDVGAGIYPAGARWAEPDIGQAAEFMARLAGDDVERERLGAAGRARMDAQPSDAATARHIAELLEIPSA